MDREIYNGHVLGTYKFLESVSGAKLCFHDELKSGGSLEVHEISPENVIVLYVNYFTGRDWRSRITLIGDESKIGEVERRILEAETDRHFLENE